MPHVAARMASRVEDAGRYQRHRPGQTTLYKIADGYYPAFATLMAEQGRELPSYVQANLRNFSNAGGWNTAFCGCVAAPATPSTWSLSAVSVALLVDEALPEQPIRQWVLSFPFQLRYLFASRPEIMGRVLGIVYRVIATHLIRQAGHTQTNARTGSVTLIQRFGSALNLNIHFHMLFLDGVYVDRPNGSARFRWVKAPTSADLTRLAHTIAHRVGRFLEQHGLLERDMENGYLIGEAVNDDPMTPLLGHSITYRIAIGPQVGRKVFTLQTLPASDEPFDDGVGMAAGFSLHVGVGQLGPMNARSSNACAATSAARRCRRSG